MNEPYEVQIPTVTVELVEVNLPRECIQLTVKYPDGTLQPVYIDFVPGRRFLLKSVDISLIGEPVTFNLMVQTSSGSPLCFRIQCAHALQVADSILDHVREYKQSRDGKAVK